jgi:hypothetical protein
LRARIFRPGSENVRACSLDGHLFSSEAAPPQFVKEKIAYCLFISGDRFDIDQTAGEFEQVIHAEKA